MKDIKPTQNIQGNPVAKSLSLPMNRPRTEQAEKGKGSYSRKQKHKIKDFE